MNRTALCIKMLMYLKANGQTNTNALAQYLDTNPRNIREFKKELVTAGYNIQEKKGRYGGYYLEEKDLFPSINLTSEEINSMSAARTFLKSHKEFDQFNSFDEASIKVINTSRGVSVENSVKVFGQPNVELSDKEKKYVKILLEARKNHQCVQLKYRNANSKRVYEVLIDPYEVLLWNNVLEYGYYCVAYKHNTSDIRNYRISELRMVSCELSDQTFLRDNKFILQQHIGETTIFKKKTTHVKVKVKSEDIIHDMYWGTNIKKEDENIYSFDVEDPYILFSQVFFQRENIEIIGPDKIREDYIESLKSILNIYEKEV